VGQSWAGGGPAVIMYIFLRCLWAGGHNQLIFGKYHRRYAGPPPNYALCDQGIINTRNFSALGKFVISLARVKRASLHGKHYQIQKPILRLILDLQFYSMSIFCKKQEKYFQFTVHCWVVRNLMLSKYMYVSRVHYDLKFVGVEEQN